MLARPPHDQVEGTAAGGSGRGAQGQGYGGSEVAGDGEGGELELPVAAGGQGRAAASVPPPAVGTQGQREPPSGHKEQEEEATRRGERAADGSSSGGSGSSDSTLAQAWAELSAKLWKASLPCCAVASFWAFFCMGMLRVLQDPMLWPQAQHEPPQEGEYYSTSSLQEGTPMWTTLLIARLAGGLLFGHVGDTRGRRHALLSAMLLTGLSTLAMACLPSYARHTITWLLLLALQSVGVGGAWVGGVVVPYELCLNDRDRCVGSAVPYAASPLGLAAGASAMGMCLQGLSRREARALVGRGEGDAWRFVLLVGAAGAVSSGVWVFRNGKEAPVFTELRHRDLTAKAPIARVVLCRPLALVCGWLIMAFAALTQNLVLRGWHVLLGLPPSVHWMAATLALLSLFIIVGAYLSSCMPSLGRRGVYGLTSAVVGLGCIPWLHMPVACDTGIDKLPFYLHRQWQRAALQVCTLGPVLGVLQGPMASLLADLFDTSTLTTGTATVYHGAFLLTSLLYPHLLLSPPPRPYSSGPPSSLPVMVIGVALISALTACATRCLELTTPPTRLNHTRSLLLRECLGLPLHHSSHSSSLIQAASSAPSLPTPPHLQMGPWYEDLDAVPEEQSTDLQTSSTAQQSPPPPAAQPQAPPAPATGGHRPTGHAAPHAHQPVPSALYRQQEESAQQQFIMRSGPFCRRVE